MLLVAIATLVGCSKDEVEVADYTKNLTGLKYRAAAWYSDGNGQVYHVLEFKAGSQVEYSLRLNGATIFNSDYTKTFPYTIVSPTKISFNNQEAITTGEVLTISEGDQEGAYLKY